MPALEIKREDERVRTLCLADPKLGELIHQIGDLTVPLREDYYLSLVKSIVGQQLSVKAANTIFSRVSELVNGQVTPELIHNLSDEQLRSAGVSRSKITYIKNLSEKVSKGELNLEDIDSLSDQEVMKKLVELKGIGKWTAEMFLIFSLGREDVLSLGDVSLQRAVQWLYGEDGTEIQLADCYGQWKPYNTIASLYLWEALDLGYLKK